MTRARGRARAQLVTPHECETCGDPATVSLPWGYGAQYSDRWLCTVCLAGRGYDEDGVWSGDGTYWSS